MDTKLFLDHISKWWKIMNTKHPLGGLHCLDNRLQLIKKIEILFFEWTSLLDPRMEFHESSKCKWKESSWHSKSRRNASKETFCALKLTIQCVVELVPGPYMVENLEFLMYYWGSFKRINSKPVLSNIGKWVGTTTAFLVNKYTSLRKKTKKLRILSLTSLNSKVKNKFELRDLLKFRMPEFTRSALWNTREFLWSV